MTSSTSYRKITTQTNVHRGIVGIRPKPKPHRKRLTYIAAQAEYVCGLIFYQEWFLPSIAKHVLPHTYQILEYFGLAGYIFKCITSFHKLEEYLSLTAYYDFQEHIFYERRRLDKAFLTFLDLGISLAAGVGYIFSRHAAWSINCFIAFGVIYFITGLYAFLKDFHRLYTFRRDYHAGLDKTHKHLRLSLKQLFYGKTPFDDIPDYTDGTFPTDDQFIKISFQYHRAQLQKSSVDLLFLSLMGAAALLWLGHPAFAVVAMITLGIAWAIVRNKYEKRAKEAKATAKIMSENHFSFEDEDGKIKKLKAGHKPTFWALENRKHKQDIETATHKHEEELKRKENPGKKSPLVLVGFTSRLPSPPTSTNNSKTNLKLLNGHYRLSPT